MDLLKSLNSLKDWFWSSGRYEGNPAKICFYSFSDIIAVLFKSFLGHVKAMLKSILFKD